MLKLNYDYGSTQNNGNVLSQTITVNRSNQSPLVFSQSYVYDSLNRLKSAAETANGNPSWNQTYTFDRYGNRRFDQTNTTQPNSFANPNVTNPSIDPSNNRFTTGQGWTYDLAGNVITDAEGRSFTYDGENKQVAATNSSAMLGTYYFDGDGKRVKKVVASTDETTVFVYDAGGNLVAEYSNVVQPTSNAKVQYLTSDNLGTPRINTDATGNIISRSDYMPYGEEIIALGGRSANDRYVADDVRQGFTGYERDGETGLDYAEARYFSCIIGRFTRPDYFVNSTHISDPQSWNLYIYVGNNPLKFIDPSGEKAKVTVETDKEKKTGTITIDANFGVYVEKGNYSAEEIQKQVDLLKKQITETYSAGAGAGVTSGDGITYTITVNVNVSVYGSEEAAEQAGSRGEVDNIVGLVKERTLSGGTAVARGYSIVSENFDRMVVATQSNVQRNNTYAHEFGHLLGLSGHLPEGSQGLMARFAPAATYLTSKDFDLTLGNTVRNHEQGKVAVVGIIDGRDRTAYKKQYGYQSKTTQIVRAPSYWWDWNY